MVFKARKVFARLVCLTRKIFGKGMRFQLFSSAWKALLRWSSCFCAEYIGNSVRACAQVAVVALQFNKDLGILIALVYASQVFLVARVILFM